MPLVIVNVAPVFEQTPPFVNVTGVAGPAAGRGDGELRVEDGRGRRVRRHGDRLVGLVTVAFCVFCGAAAYLPFPAWSAATTQLPAWFAVSVLPVTLHGPERTL